MSESTRSNLIKAMAAVDAADAVEDQIKAEADEFFEAGKPQHPKAPNPQAEMDELNLQCGIAAPVIAALIDARATAKGLTPGLHGYGTVIDPMTLREFDVIRGMIARARQ
jgi:hypothetical protein